VDLLDQGQDYPGPYKDTTRQARLALGHHPRRLHRRLPARQSYADFRYVLALSVGAPVPQSADTGGGRTSRSTRWAVARTSGSYTPGTSAAPGPQHLWDPRTDTIHSALPDTVDLQVLASQDAVEAALLSGSADLDWTGIAFTDQTETKVLKTALKPIRTWSSAAPPAT